MSSPSIQKPNEESAGLVPVIVPRLGEGLIEARIVTHLKTAGEWVERDEPIVDLETDKATLSVEASTSGVLVRWLCSEGDVMVMGSVIGLLRPIESVNVNTLERGTEAVLNAHVQTGNSGKTLNGHRAIFQRQETAEVPARPSNERLTLSPFEEPQVAISGNYELDGETGEANQAMESTWDLVELSPRASRLAGSLSRAQAKKVRATLEIECDWSSIEKETPAFRRHTLLAWSAIQTMREHPSFRSTWHDEGLRRHRCPAIGMAVALPGDELNTAVVSVNDGGTFEEFALDLRNAVDEARQGVEPNIAAHLFMTALQPYHVLSATPLVVPPATSTLFVGAPYDLAVRGEMDSVIWKRKARLALSFDHRFINGVGAASFLNEIACRIAELPGD